MYIPPWINASAITWAILDLIGITRTNFVILQVAT